jgi:hypothetical protein
MKLYPGCSGQVAALNTDQAKLAPARRSHRSADSSFDSRAEDGGRPRLHRMPEIRTRVETVRNQNVARRTMLVALEELGLEYEHVPLNTQGESRKPEYLKVPQWARSPPSRMTARSSGNRWQ